MITTVNQAGGARAVSGSALFALVGASLPMKFLDPAIHNIAVVAAGNALHMTGTERSLAASIGTLCIAATILATGSLGDRLGRRKIMVVGLLVTLAGGVLTAVAQTPLMFALGRALSGVGFAASFGLSFSLLRAVAPVPDALAKAVAKWLALQTLGIVVLCLVGGYLAGVSWRAAYLLGPGVGILAMFWCLKVVPEARDPSSGRFDGVGLVLVALGLVATLYSVSNAAWLGQCPRAGAADRRPRPHGSVRRLGMALSPTGISNPLVRRSRTAGWRLVRHRLQHRQRGRCDPALAVVAVRLSLQAAGSEPGASPASSLPALARQAGRAAWWRAACRCG